MHKNSGRVAKGDKVRVEDNSIFTCMGHKVVTGTVFMVYPDLHGFAIKCDQTGAMECVDFDDGTLEVQR